MVTRDRATTACSWRRRMWPTTASIGNDVIMANNATLGGHVEVGDYAMVGGLAPCTSSCASASTR